MRLYELRLTMEELCSVHYALRSRVAELEQRVAQYVAAGDRQKVEDSHYLLEWTRRALRQITAEGRR